MGDHSGEAEDSTSSSLGLLDAEHVDVFRKALKRILSADIAETTFSEIIDGLPMRSTWLQFDLFNEQHPVNVLGHETLCEGAREKARRFRDELDIYILSFPSKTLHDFQQANAGAKEYHLSLIELLVRSCHQIAARLFQLDDGFHKHSVYEKWRDAPVDPQSNPWRVPPSPSAFCHGSYTFYEQYPHGIADVVGYWAEARIFGGVVVFDRGPSGVERREVYLHAGHQQAPRTLFPPTSDQLDSLMRFLLQPDAGPCPLPITASRLNGYRYHPQDAISRFNIFRDRYERKEPPTRSTHHSWNNARNWPEIEYQFEWIALQEKRAQGIEIDEAELAAAEEGIRRITPSSPDWHASGMTDSPQFSQ